MNDHYWSWLLSVVGVAGFILAGRKIWWAWYINIACQILWFAYAIISDQLGFLVGAFFYTAVFVRNAYLWTKEHKQKVREKAWLEKWNRGEIHFLEEEA